MVTINDMGIKRELEFIKEYITYYTGYCDYNNLNHKADDEIEFFNWKDFISVILYDTSKDLEDDELEKLLSVPEEIKKLKSSYTDLDILNMVPPELEMCFNTFNNQTFQVRRKLKQKAKKEAEEQ